jgi:tRNA pseudouridine38-40 synthase
VPRLDGVNALLPDEIAVLDAEVAPDGFDARRSARARTYCYRVLARRAQSPFERGRALHWPYPVDRAALDACAQALPGEHDFTAFTPTETDHVRFSRVVLDAAWREGADGIFEFWITADAFMRQMNRILVGTMLEVAGGRRSVADFGRLLQGAHRRDAGVTAPAHGLYLARVDY